LVVKVIQADVELHVAGIIKFIWSLSSTFPCCVAKYVNRQSRIRQCRECGKNSKSKESNKQPAKSNAWFTGTNYKMGTFFSNNLPCGLENNKRWGMGAQFQRRYLLLAGVRQAAKHQNDR
jgi:hypothetical protein